MHVYKGSNTYIYSEKVSFYTEIKDVFTIFTGYAASHVSVKQFNT